MTRYAVLLICRPAAGVTPRRWLGKTQLFGALGPVTKPFRYCYEDGQDARQAALSAGYDEADFEVIEVAR